MHAMKKVEIVIDAAARDRIVEIARDAGAKGHTVVPRVSGQGPRGVRVSHDIFDETPNVLIVVIAPAAVAERIVAAASELLERQAGILTVTDVQVVRRDHF
jgi:PII-like signaling protein